MHIVKASGNIEEFSADRLRRSLAASGATDRAIDLVIKKIIAELKEGDSTRVIYKKAFSLLKKHPGAVAGRYKLKAAIIELGPTGYPFEKFVATIFKQMGYKTQTGQIIDGACVKHEVDIICTQEDSYALVECKFHNVKGIICDVKVPLYINARFQDIEKRKNGDTTGSHFEGWVVTNTRFSDDALQYGNCNGLKMMGWDYPKNNSLNDLIDKYKLYPITCLTTLTKYEKELLLLDDIILCSELLNNPYVLGKVISAAERRDKIMNECKALAGT